MCLAGVLILGAKYTRTKLEKVGVQPKTNTVDLIFTTIRGRYHGDFRKHSRGIVLLFLCMNIRAFKALGHH